VDVNALFKISYGMYVVTSKMNGRVNGQIANTFIQVTAEPLMVAVCINKLNLTHEFIEKSRVFAVSILSEDTPLQFIGRFGFKTGRTFNKFEGVNFRVGVTGAPIILENTIAYVEAEVVKECDIKTHTMFIGKVVDAGMIKEGEPMTYAYYHTVKKGKTPKAASTYVGEQPPTNPYHT